MQQMKSTKSKRGDTTAYLETKKKKRNVLTGDEVAPIPNGAYSSYVAYGDQEMIGTLLSSPCESITIASTSSTGSILYVATLNNLLNIIVMLFLFNIL
jgi:hypothetical protein